MGGRSDQAGIRFKQRCLLLLVIVICVPFPGQAEVYRWTDEQGRVHYSDRPVNEGAEPVEIHSSDPSTQERGLAGVSQEQRNRERQRLLDIYRDEREQKAKKRAEQKQQAEERKRRCVLLKDKLRRSRESRIYDLNDEGERRFLSEDERNRTLAALEQEVAHWCR